MSEKKKVGLDIARSSTLVQEYQVASWERNELPTTPELTAIDEKIAKDPENAELHKERGLLLAGLATTVRRRNATPAPLPSIPSTGNTTAIVRTASCPAVTLPMARRTSPSRPA